MRKNQIKFLSISLFSLLFLSGCKKDGVEAGDDNELITSVKLNFTTNGTTQSFKYSDPDGDGGKAPTVENISLKANTVYALTIEILDESKKPVSNITDEIMKEKDEHLFFYLPTPSTLFTYTYGDKDSRNFNIGLAGNLKTGSMATGKLKFQLRHQPPINGKAVKDGTITPGSDDINIDFNVSIL